MILLAADAGDGWVPLGPTAAKAGRKVATVFEDPSVVASDVEIFRTHTHELQIVGTGFNKLARPTIDFDPPLNSDNIYVDVSFFSLVRVGMYVGFYTSMQMRTAVSVLRPARGCSLRLSGGLL